MGMRWRRAEGCGGAAYRLTAPSHNDLRIVHASVLALCSLLRATQQSGLKFGHLGKEKHIGSLRPNDNVRLNARILGRTLAVSGAEAAPGMERIAYHKARFPIQAEKRNR